MQRFVAPRLLPLLTFLAAAGLTVLGWWLPNRPVDPLAAASSGKFNSLSYAAYRPGESPLTDSFATRQEVDQDLELLAGQTRAIRTYAAFEGPYDIAELAQKHGLKLWQGIWLGGDRAKNAREMDRAIALAHQYPKTIERVIVGNEVLLRRDLPVAELIADIDHVRAAVAQPVAYADVSDFWQQFPEIAPHVAIVMIHLLPYWEDTPTGIDHAVAYVGQVFRHFQTLFPKSRITIGETGWPSRGRERRDAVPSRLAQARFLREFMALSRAEKFDYNFIEAFDQTWKYENEGIVGANWGLFTAARTSKIPLEGPLEEDPDWRMHAVLSLVCGTILAACGLAASPRATPGRRSYLVGLGMAAGAAVTYAQADIAPVLYDPHVRLAAAVNLVGQSTLAMLLMMREAGALPPAVLRNGADATARVRGMLRLRWAGLDGAFEDLGFVFLWTAMVVQALLLFDPRYREFPVSSFVVPLLAVVIQAMRRELPLSGGGREELAAGLVLAVFAVASAIQEGWLNHQSVVWNCCALILAVPALLKFTRDARTGQERSSFGV